MSSILKALKKLEHERSGRSPDSLKIDSDILRANEPSRSFTPFVLALLFLLVFGGGAAVSLFFMKETKATRGTTTSDQVVSSITLLPPVPAPVVKPGTLPAEAAAVPVRTEPSGEASHKLQQKPAAAGKAADTGARKPTRAAVSGISEKPKETDKAANGELPAADTTVPTLRVNGIAYQNSDADSLAIVNGAPVSSGSVIEGVTVVEVRKDRVLFQRDGETFEIQMGQSNR